jgi:MFS family permease
MTDSSGRSQILHSPRKEASVALNARSLLLICWTSGCWAFSFGLGTQVVSHWLQAQGASGTVIGLNHSFYYFGMAIGSFAVPWLTRRLGPAGCARLGMIASGITLALFPWSDGEYGSYLLRFLNGWAAAMSVIPLETIVSRDSAIKTKTRNFGYYGAAMVLGGAVGMSISLHLYAVGVVFAFCLGGAVPVITGFILQPGVATPSQPAETQSLRVSLGLLSNFLSYGTAWCQGFLEGLMISFLSLYLEAVGYTKGVAGMFVGLATIGTILLVVPISWLGDRCGKTQVLLGCYGMTALGLIVIPWLTNAIGLGSVLFVFGACAGAMYPLGLSLLTDRMPESGLARAYAWYLAIECVGSLVGAAAVGKARDLWGETAMFPVGLSAVMLVIATWLGLQYHWRNRMTSATQSPAKENHRQEA